VRASIQRMLDAHDPYPGVVIDRQWNVLLMNGAAGSLLGGVASAVLVPRPNVFRVCLHPEGLARQTLNFDEWADYLLGQLRRSIRLTGDAALQEIEDEISAYPNLEHLRGRAPVEAEPPLLVPFRFRTDSGAELSLFTTLTTFGTPRDITLDELAVELFFPADDPTEQLLRAG